MPNLEENVAAIASAVQSMWLFLNAVIILWMQVRLSRHGARVGTGCVGAVTDKNLSGDCWLPSLHMRALQRAGKLSCSSA
jgi:hypothetical protein